MKFKDDGYVYMTQEEYDELNDRNSIVISGKQELVRYYGYLYKIKIVGEQNDIQE